MNDELVSHNNSNGGWAVLNKWVSMLKEEGCMFDPLKARGGGGGVASNCKLHCVVCRLKCVEFHQHTAISALASSEEMSYVKYHLFRLFVSAFIGMQNMREGPEVFPGMSRVTLRMCSPPTSFFTPFQLRYATPAATLTSAWPAPTPASPSGQELLRH